MLPFTVTDQDDRKIGEFSSVDDAKASLPQVTEWRADETRELGWNGWVDPVPFSAPDYKITFVSSSRSGFVRLDPGATVVAPG